jgi:anthranilate synthase
MAVEHRTLPFAAVQFHPESIMTLGDDFGLRLLANVVACLTATPEADVTLRRSAG